MRISDWSSDVCSSDLARRGVDCDGRDVGAARTRATARDLARAPGAQGTDEVCAMKRRWILFAPLAIMALLFGAFRSEEHTSELQSLMRISYAVFCLKKKKTKNTPDNYNTNLQSPQFITTQSFCSNQT